MQVSAAGKVEDELHTNTGLEPVPDIYALGDCCANVETPLPALAQVRPSPARPAQAAAGSDRAGTDLRGVVGHPTHSWYGRGSCTKLLVLLSGLLEPQAGCKPLALRDATARRA